MLPSLVCWSSADLVAGATVVCRCVQCMSPVLEQLTFVDTPGMRSVARTVNCSSQPDNAFAGVLSGEKQRVARGYEFTDLV